MAQRRGAHSAQGGVRFLLVPPWGLAIVLARFSLAGRPQSVSLGIAQGEALDARGTAKSCGASWPCFSAARRPHGRNRTGPFPALESVGTQISNGQLRTGTTLKETRHEPPFRFRASRCDSGSAATVPRGSVDRRAELPSSLARCRGGAGTVCDHDQRPLDRGRLVHPGRAASRHGDHRRGSRRHAADNSRCLGGRQPGGGADRSAGSGRRGFGAASISAGSFTLGQSAEMVLTHFKTIGDATDLPLIVFQYPLATGQGYPAATLERLFDEVPTIRAIKDWTPLVPQHESQIRALQGRERPVNVLSTNSAWLLSSLVLGCNGLLSGSGNVIADLQARLYRAVKVNDLAEARRLNDRIYPMARVFYADPFVDMHNRMKEALVLLGKLPRAVVRPPLVKLGRAEIDRIRAALVEAGLVSQKAARDAA